MEVARASEVDGILAICGGCCSCATCHVYVLNDGLKYFPEPTAEEHDLLTGVTSERRPTSRLSCQLRITENMPDITVEVPDSQT
jgi:2Fe-2S ferredoxin